MERNYLSEKLYVSEKQLNSQTAIKRGGSHKHLSTTSYHDSSSWVSRSMRTLSKSAGDLVRQSSADLLGLQTGAFTPIYKSPTLIESEQSRSGDYDVPDQGYAWVVLISTFICNMMPAVLLYASGIFYTLFVEEFGSPIVLSWIISIQASLYMALGPLAAFIVKITDARITTMMGFIGLSISFLISSRMKSVTGLVICFGVIPGFFGSLVFLPSSIYARKYFKKKKALALTAPTLGVPLVLFIIVPIIKEIMIEYGWRNASMFIAAVYAQCLVPAMLLREPNFRPEDHNEMNDGSDDTPVKSQEALHKSWQTTNNYASKFSVNLEHSFSCHRPADSVYGADNNTQENDDNTESTSTSSSNSDSTNCCSILRNIGFLIFVFSYFLWGVGSSIFFLLLPDFLKERQVEERSVSHIYVSMGVLAFITRAAVCLISAKFEYNKLMLASISFFVQGASNIGLVMLDSFSSYIIFATLTSAGYSVMATLPGSIVHVLINSERDTELAFGFAHLAFGFAVLVAPPVSATLTKLLGSYNPGMLVGSGFLFMAAVFYFAISIRLHLIQRIRQPAKIMI